MSNLVIYRILDAAANRGREALRVIEDCARYIDDNREFTAALKAARHRLAAAAEKLDRRQRLLARDTVGDVGVSIEAEDEYRRESLQQLLTANFARLQEAARSLEEYSKIVEPKLAREFEIVRYESYTLEKIAYELALRFEEQEAEQAREQDVEQSQNAAPAREPQEPAREEPELADTPQPAAQPTEEAPAERGEDSPEETQGPCALPARNEEGSEFSPFARRPRSRRELLKDRLGKVALSFLVDRPLDPATIDALFRANIGAFQLALDPADEAEKNALAFFLTRYAERFLQGERVGRRPLLFSRGFLAWGNIYDGGVVLTDGWREAREYIGNDKLLGALVSNAAEMNLALEAARAGALDFIELGPVFAKTPNERAVGVEFLRGVVLALDGNFPVPIFAVGGVDLTTCEAVFDSGIERVVVESNVLNNKDGFKILQQMNVMF